MGQAQIYWDMEQYSKVQSILQQSADFCSEHEAWKLNSAHAHFMQGGVSSRGPLLVILLLNLSALTPYIQVFDLHCDTCAAQAPPARQFPVDTRKAKWQCKLVSIRGEVVPNLRLELLLQAQQDRWGCCMSGSGQPTP